MDFVEVIAVNGDMKTEKITVRSNSNFRLNFRQD
jgi:hypothetical protein